MDRQAKRYAVTVFIQTNVFACYCRECNLMHSKTYNSKQAADVWTMRHDQWHKNKVSEQ